MTTLAHSNHNLWYYVWKLLRLRWMIFFNGLRHAKPRRKIGYAIFSLFMLGLLVGAFAASWFILDFLRSPRLAEIIGPAMDVNLFLSSVPVMVTSASFLGITLTSFGVLLQALYLAGDMDFLLSAPLPMRAVFVTKLLQAILPNFSLVCLFGLPVLFGLGASGGYTLLYYPLVVLVLAALALAAAGLSSLLVMGSVRIFPARRVAEVLGFIGGIISLLCSQSGQFTSRAEFSEAQTAQALRTLTRFNAPWSPLAWAGRGLVDLGEGRWISGLALLALTLGLSAAILGIALATAERLYYTGWANVQLGTVRKPAGKKRPAPESVEPAGFSLGRVVYRFVRRLFPAQVRGLMVKDWLTLRRDLRNMSQLITPLILGVVYAVMLTSGGRSSPSPDLADMPVWMAPLVRDAAVYGHIGLSLFVGWSLLMRLAMMGFSQEGRCYWLLKVAPLSAGRLLLAKFLVAYLPTLTLSWGFLLALSLVRLVSRGDVGSLLALAFGLPATALCLAGEAGLNLAFGVVGVNLEWEDPRRMMSGSMGCVGALVSMAYMGVSLALFFLPPIIVAMVGGPGLLGQALGLAIGGAAGLVCAVFPPWLVLARVARIGEG